MKTAVIVDAYSAGVHYAKILKDYGFKLIHVQSRVDLPEAYHKSFRAEDFDLLLSCDSNTVTTLKQHNPEFLIPGIESGVVDSDRLSEILGLKSNGRRFSEARRNKWLMSERVKQMGLRTIEQRQIKSEAELIDWCKPFSRFVLKPLNSAGSDAVRVCANLEQGIQHLRENLGKKNKLGLKNESFLVQEFIEGQEYAVNAASFAGKIKISAIWEYRKRQSPSGDFIYDYEYLIDPREKRYEALIQYVKKVNAALGIDYGPSHSEIMVDSLGPVLIESAARIDGIANPGFESQILDHGQHELAISSYLRALGETEADRYVRVKCEADVSLISEVEGQLAGQNLDKLLPTLKSYVSHVFKFKTGDSVVKTSDIFTSPGVIHLAHASEQTIAADIAEIRKWETASQLYKVKS